MTTSILIVDDHPVFRFGLRVLLGTEPDMQIAGKATTGAEALALAAGQPPDLVLMGINLPDLTGLEVTRRLRAAGEQEIRALLSLSVKTVRNRVSDIFSKLQMIDRAEEIIKARAAGIG